MAIGNRRLLRDRPSDGAASVCKNLGGRLVVRGWCRKDAGKMMCAWVRGSLRGCSMDGAASVCKNFMLTFRGVQVAARTWATLAVAK